MLRIANDLSEDGAVAPQRLISVGLALLSAGLTGFVLYACWLTAQVRADVASARRSAQELVAALGDADRPGAEAALEALRRQVSDADAGEATATWWVLSRLPGVRDDVDALSRETSALREQADAGAASLAPEPEGSPGAGG